MSLSGFYPAWADIATPFCVDCDILARAECVWMQDLSFTYRVSKSAVLVGTTALYTTSNSRWFSCSMIHVGNTSGAAVTVDVYLVPAAGAPLQTNALLYGFSVPANDFIEFGDGFWFPPGSSLQAKASSDSVIVFQVSGSEQAGVGSP
jgi:hypothetical protein